MMREIRRSEGLNGEDEKYLIRRKLLPVEVIIDKSGQVKTFRVKLSPGIMRITGVMTTMDTMVPAVQGDPVWYFGPGNAPNLFNSAFITRLRSGAFNRSFFSFRHTLDKGQWLYYAQPVSMNFFFVWGGAEFRKRATVPITDPDTGFTEDYDIWVSEEGPGQMHITVEIEE
ncbi:hypothetical protein C900_02345 [Fulvivirga imtechensis AK7]|uniref:Uncharacterized protein n=1 Tax=Fulvivirga imtechensis AK7 TaxID=1237149 RepID=L8JSE8_9BACT|nr:hypothetical protein [Fulvivirga imtechensis]ELR71760.1 hypothetical protein C900_02345 [Fulvivirga imtechensis AK7]